MKVFRKLGPTLLITFFAIAGCVNPQVSSPSKGNASRVDASSCTERSAAAGPPKNAIVELAWCIAETDNLYDPDHLFHKTLGIKDYGIAEVPFGVRAFAGGNHENFDRLPVGILGFQYMRNNPEVPQTNGDRYLSFGIDLKKSCVKLEDVFATFGRDFEVSPVPIKVPSPAVPGTSVGTAPKISSIFGVFYKSPGVFIDDSSAFVQFTFDYFECANHISIQRNFFTRK